MDIKRKFQKLKNLDDFTWGLYAFSRDIVNGKLNDAQRSEFIEKSYACGKNEAVKIRESFGNLTPREYAEKLGLKITEKKGGDTKDRFIFGQFNLPNKISVFSENVRKTEQMVSDRHLDAVLEGTDLEGLIISHEIFHSIELKDKTLYTSSIQVPLWKLLGFTYKSGLIATGEIAAMAFAREIMGISYNPFIFDMLLLYMKDEAKCERAVKKVLSLSPGLTEQSADE